MSNKSRTDYEITIQQERGEEGRLIEVRGGMPEELRMDNTSTWEAPFSQGLLGMLPGSISSALKMFGVRPATQMMTLQVWQGTEGSDLTFDLVFTTDSDPVNDVQRPVLDLLSMVVPSVDETGFIITPGPTLDPAKARAMFEQVVKTASELKDGVQAAGGVLFNMSKDVGKGLSEGTMNDSSKDVAPQAGVPQAGKSASREKARSNREEMASCVRNRISICFGRFLFIRDVIVVAANPQWSMTYLDGETGLPNMATVSVTIRPLFAVTMQDLEDMFQVAIPDVPKSTTPIVSPVFVGSSDGTNYTNAQVDARTPLAQQVSKFA